MIIKNTKLFISLLLLLQHAYAQTDCKSRINHHRTKYGEELIEEREDLHDCANRQSQYDDVMGAHKSYKRCGGLGSQGSGGGSNCANVIDMFFNERWRCSKDISIIGTPIATSTNNFRDCRQACLDHSTCLSFDHDGDSNSCRFYDEASLTHAFTVGGNYWLGAPDFTATAPAKVDTWKSFSMIEIDGSNAFPVDGKISSIKYYGSNSNGVDFFVYRLVSGINYKVVGKLAVASTTVGVENIVTANPAINVQKGDVVGWTWKGSPAFGFTANSEGQVLFTYEENSGGPSDVGDEWTFNSGSYSRHYHMAVSYVPDQPLTATESPNYCAAALCKGHCGPVMDGDRTSLFSWGVYNNHYTLNWRPNARFPSGVECPSGIGAVKCWTDPETQVLWAYGVGGEDCHSTCSLAGASPADFMCDEDVPITGGFAEVSRIMLNFENDFNANGVDEFTCTSGTCWSGESNKQIMIHEYNSNCYVPTNTQKYVCDAIFGNANCFGQRFNQVCPCKAGCSWAAGPSCAPSPAPSMEPSEVTEPLPDPSMEPSEISSDLCQDTWKKFEYGKSKKMKTCLFVSNSKEKRCVKQGVASQCPVTCGSDCTCFDTEGKFNFRKKKRSCRWVERNNKCNIFNLYARCPVTCKAC